LQIISGFLGGKNKMEICKRYQLNKKIREYETFLLKAGIDEAKRRGKNIRFGLEGRAVINGDIYQTIHLSQDENGLDISPILALGAENHPDEARRYYLYGKMLERMKK